MLPLLQPDISSDEDSLINLISKTNNAKVNSGPKFLPTLPQGFVDQYFSDKDSINDQLSTDNEMPKLLSPTQNNPYDPIASDKDPPSI
jgi:hypothetical protein